MLVLRVWYLIWYFLTCSLVMWMTAWDAALSRPSSKAKLSLSGDMQGCLSEQSQQLEGLTRVPWSSTKRNMTLGTCNTVTVSWYSLGTGRLGSNCRKDCAAPVAGKLTMSQWCSLLVMRLTVQAGLVKAQPAHQGNIIFLDLAPLRLHLEYFVQFWVLSSTREIFRNRRESATH